MFFRAKVSSSPCEKDSDYFAQNEEIYENFWNSQKKFLSLQRERRSQVEPRCAERWHGWRVKPTEMMSNSTLPLGFLHSNTELVTCGQFFLYLDVAFAVELLLVSSSTATFPQLFLLFLLQPSPCQRFFLSKVNSLPYWLNGALLPDVRPRAGKCQADSREESDG